MPESMTNDELLTMLGDARPSFPANDLKPDSVGAIALLQRILAADRFANEDIVLPLDDTEIVQTTHPQAPPASTRAQWPRRRTVGALVALAVAVVLAAVGAASLLNNGTQGRIAEGGSSWRLTGYITQPAWQVQPAIGSDPFLLDCTSTTTCYATGLSAPPPSAGDTSSFQSVVEVTHNGGTTWQPSSLPSAGMSIASITCPAVDTCMLAGANFSSGAPTDVMFTTTDGGQSWSSLPLPGTGGSTSVLSCATTLNCDALQSLPGPDGLGVRYVSDVTSDGGRTWSSFPMPGTFRGYALQCTASDYCIAGGNQPTAYRIADPSTQHGPAAILYSSDGGVTWDPGAIPVIPADGNTIGKISCADRSHCMALSYNIGPGDFASHVVVTTDGGQTWAPSPGALPQLNLEALSCPTDADCWVAGSTLSGADGDPSSRQGVIYFTDDGGQSWTSEQVPPYQGSPLGFVDGLSCPAPSNCLAVAEFDRFSIWPATGPIEISVGTS